MTQVNVTRYASSVTLGHYHARSATADAALDRHRRDSVCLLARVSIRSIRAGSTPCATEDQTDPARAAARRLEGYVIVTDSSNALFDRYAVDAAYKFKYKPHFIDGVPVDSHGMRNKFTFVLEN